MRKIRVNTGAPYDILIERGLTDKVGELVRELGGANKICVISDTNVAPLYGERVINSLKDAGFEVCSYTFEAGERQKTLATIAGMYAVMANFGMSRKDMVVALGGGVTGDMAGFAAATYMRGIRFVQIPTSLLAQVDSSVGGKTGVDIPQGKNLVGAFAQPSLVIIDPDSLDTLPEFYFSDGMGEVIKYGCIKDAELFKTLENGFDDIENIIEICVSIKRDVVERDEKESGERMLLNFGHTWGHALEKHYNFESLSHGRAVAIGMVALTEASERLGLTEKGSADRLRALCEKYGLPVSDSAPTDEIAALCANDKKAAGDSVNLVLLSKIGESFIRETKLAEINGFITE